MPMSPELACSFRLPGSGSQIAPGYRARLSLRLAPQSCSQRGLGAEGACLFNHVDAAQCLSLDPGNPVQ